VVIIPCEHQRYGARTLESRPEVGSSTKRTAGFTINSHPMEVRLRSPPLMPRMSSFPTGVSAHLTSSKRSIIALRTIALSLVTLVWCVK
jgi:hypothetical protein